MAEKKKLNRPTPENTNFGTFALSAVILVSFESRQQKTCIENPEYLKIYLTGFGGYYCFKF